MTTITPQRNPTKRRVVIVSTIAAVLAVLAAVVVAIGPTPASSSSSADDASSSTTAGTGGGAPGGSTTESDRSTPVGPGAGVEPGGGGGTGSASSAAEPADFAVVVDEGLAPAAAEVGGLEDGEAARPTGRMRTGDGDVTDVVLDELIVSTRSAAELDALLERWGGEVVDRFEPEEGDEWTDSLVRVDPGAVDPVDVAADLLATEPYAGELGVSSDRMLRLLAIMAAEAANHGTVVTLNPLEQGEGIVDGVVNEADDRPNVFGWSFMRGGGVQDFAVAPAWQLLDAHGRLEPSVRMMINDGGFSPNPDFPDDITLRHAQWGDTNRVDCGGSSCPYHGTDVLMTAVGNVDNGYATAGTGGPVIDDVVAVAVYKDKWKRLRRLASMVDEYRPDVVNMSYSSTITAGRAAAQSIFDRRYRKMTERGALLVAAAGNNGWDLDQSKCVAGVCFERRLKFPCESAHVLCVGGLARNTTNRAGNSNFGAEDNTRSVEIWGPYTTVSINDPTKAFSDVSTRNVSGTSFASPFVAGVAALVKAADPSLGPDEVRAVLNDTANVGVGGGTWITGSLRRVDALAAVAAALGVDVPAPQVEIQFPANGEDYPVSEWLQLKGTATDFAGRALPITWESSIDGLLGDPQVAPLSLGALSVGTHVLTASATDTAGVTASASVTFEVAHREPEVTITAPSPGTEVYEGQPIPLHGNTSDPDDYWAKLPEGDVEWSIRPAGAGGVLWSATGHQAQVPGGALSPGAYEVTFAGTSPGGTGEETVPMTVAAVPSGEDLPDVVITAPSPGSEFHLPAGNDAELTLSGSATDPQDGTIPGTQLRWVARSGAAELVLCTGSDFASAGSAPGDDAGSPGIGGLTGGAGGSGGPALDGGLQAQVDCSSTDVSLPLPPGAPEAESWQLILEARDSAGLVGSAQRAVYVYASVG